MFSFANLCKIVGLKYNDANRLRIYKSWSKFRTSDLYRDIENNQYSKKTNDCELGELNNIDSSNVHIFQPKSPEIELSSPDMEVELIKSINSEENKIESNNNSIDKNAITESSQLKKSISPINITEIEQIALDIEEELRDSINSLIKETETNNYVEEKNADKNVNYTDTNDNLHLVKLEENIITTSKKKSRNSVNLGEIEVPLNIWSNLWVKDKLDSKQFPEIVSDLIVKLTKCFIYIKGTDYNKNSITTRAYCGHNNCSSFKIHNGDLEKGIFKVYANTTEINHSNLKTRQVRGSERNMFKKLLAEKPLEKVFEESVINEDKHLIEYNVTKVKGMEVLRKIKSEMHSQNDNDPNIISDILLEIEKLNESSWIRHASLHPFYVQCWSVEQIEMLKYHKNQLNGEELVAYLDASGSFFKSVNEHPEYYYSLVIPLIIKNKEPADPISIADMVSCSHTINTITLWLKSYRTFIEKEFKMWPIINTIVTDYSFAQIHSILDVFNNCDIIKYLQNQYTFVTQNKNLQNLVKLHLCISHLMHCFTTDVNSSFRKGTKANKILKEIFAAIIIEKSYENVKDIFKNLSVLLKNKYITDDVMSSLNKISAIISEKENIISLKYEETCDDVDTFQLSNRNFNKTLYSQSPFYIEFKEISDSIEGSQLKFKSSAINLFFNETFLEKMLKNS